MAVGLIKIKYGGGEIQQLGLSNEFKNIVQNKIEI